MATRTEVKRDEKTGIWNVHGVPIERGCGIRVKAGKKGTTFAIRFMNGGRECEEWNLTADNKADANNAKDKCLARLGAIGDKQSQVGGTLDAKQYNEFFSGSPRAEWFRGKGEIDTGALKVDVLLADWLADRPTKVEDVSVVNSKRYIDDYILPYWTGKSAADISIESVRNFVKHLAKETKLSATSLGCVLTPLRNAIDFAILDSEKLKGFANPMTNLKLKPMVTAFWHKDRKDTGYKPNPYTATERAKFLAHLRAKGKVDVAELLEVWWYTGMRPSEIFALEWNSVYLDTDDKDGYTSCIRVTQAWSDGKMGKGKTPKAIRRIPMIGPVEAILRERLKRVMAAGVERKNNFVFPRKDGTPHAYIARNYGIIWKRRCKSAGVTYRRPYQNRHTFASMMIKAGMDVVQLAEIMGHDDPAVTYAFYITFIEEARSEASRNGYDLRNLNLAKIAA